MTEPDWYEPPRAESKGEPPVSRPATPTEPAGFWIRAAARGFDTLAGMAFAIVGVFIGGFVAALIATARGDAGWQTRLATQTLADYGWSFGASLLYHTLGEGIGGITIGKLICGLRVLREDDSPPTIPSGLVRSLGYYVDALFFGAVAWGSMSKSERKQRLGDKWAGTVVVHARSIDRAARRSPIVGLLVAIGVWIVCVALGTLLKVL